MKMNAAAQPLSARRLSTPRTAAVAGILFAVLFGTALVLIGLSIPSDPAEGGAWLEGRGGTVTLALSLVPFAGIFFLWFIGVVRDRLGELEDRFFSSVFFGSGLLFLAMAFVSAALAAGLLASYAALPAQMIESGLYTFGRQIVYQITNVYSMRMAAVFMLSLGTVWVRTRNLPRWLAFLTFVLALFLLVSLGRSLWVKLIFPAWVLVISIHILVVNLRRQRAGAGDGMTPVVEQKE
jgi:hypothetical protein